MLKRIISLVVLSSAFILSHSQVNLQSGSATFSLPIFNWQDDKSRLNSVVALSYNSGNGLRVGDVASNVGQGWNLIAGGVITRMQVGEPDDQYPYTGNGTDLDISRYPAGILYTPIAASQGCPDALTKYPIFKSKNQVYNQPNDVAEDRQLDYFSFMFNGKAGMFVLNPSIIGTCIAVGDTKMKMTYHTADMTGQGIRTRIDTFYIQDVDGLIYKFGKPALGLTKILKAEYCDANKTMKLTQPKFKDGRVYYMAGFDQDVTNAWVVDSWYLYEIKDALTNRKITFSYTTRNINSRGGEDFSYNEGGGKRYCLVTYKTSKTQTPDITSIAYPDGHSVVFNYGADRIDMLGAKVLSSVDISYQGRYLSKHVLNTTYFILNRYGNPVSDKEKLVARLCLKSVQKIGVDLKEDSPPYVFDYYRGSTGDNFVPPAFFYAKDIWGFYNGSNSKVYSTNTGVRLDVLISQLSFDEVRGLCFLHNGVNGVYLNPNSGYAQNGLLRQIIYPTGGTLTYQYAQNYGVLNNSNTMIGGVHVSQTSSTDGGYSNGCNNAVTTQYSYVLADGTTPSLWGLEMPVNYLPTNNHWSPESKYFKWSSLSCSWKYQYPGILSQYQSISLSWWVQALNIMSPLFEALSILGTIKDIVTALAGGSVVGLVIDLIVELFTLGITCIGTPSKDKLGAVWYNTDLNSSSPLPAQYKRVEVIEGTGGIGKTVQEFTSDSDYPLWLGAGQNTAFSSRQRFAPWAYGLPKQTTVLSATGETVKTTSNVYNFNTIYFGNHCYNAAFDRTALLKKPLSETSCKCYVLKSSSQRNTNYFNPAVYNDVNTFHATSVPGVMSVDIYDLYSGRTELDTTYERVYKPNTTPAQYVETVTGYVYNDENYEPALIKTINSDGTYKQKNVYYTIDYVRIHGFCYNLSSLTTNNPELNRLVQNNIISTPVETNEVVIATDGYTANFTYDKATIFTTLSNGDIKPLKTLEGRFAQPAFRNTPWLDQGTYDGYTTNAFWMPAPRLDPSNPDYSFFKAAQTFTYDGAANLTGVVDEGNRNVGNIYGYNNKYITASAINAKPNEIFFDAFEENSGWSGTTAPTYGDQPISAFDNTLSHTGGFSGRIDKPTAGERYCHSNTTLNITLTAPTKYRVSGWVYSSGPSVDIYLFMKRANESGYFSYVDFMSTSSTNQWVYLEKEITVPADVTKLNVRLDNNGGGTVRFDDIRLYPANGRMMTYTFDPLIGKTSESDVNNRVTYYEYDNLGRLRFIKDDGRNVVKMYEYNNVSPAKQNGCPGTYYNNMIQEVFTKNNCGAGYIGSDVTFTVPANAYSSTISQFDADMKAENDILTNGQNYANTNGSCIQVYCNTQKSQTFTTENCAEGYAGGTVTYTVPAGRYCSTISQADADTMALDEIDANGQAYANEPAHVVCNIDTNPNWVADETAPTYCLSVNGQLPPHLFRLTTDINPNSPSYNQTSWKDFGPDAACAANTYYNAERSQTFQRNNCSAGYTGSYVTYTVPPGTYNSTISQADADQKAQNDINTNGQNYANTNGTCIISCSISPATGYGFATSSISSSGGTVSFYMVVYPTSSPMYLNSLYTVATITTGCRPSGTRSFTSTSGGRTWNVTVYSSGYVQVQMTSGSTVPVNNAVYIGGSYTQ